MRHFFFLFFQGKMQQANNKYGQTLKVPQSTGPPFQEDFYPPKEFEICQSPHGKGQLRLEHKTKSFPLKQLNSFNS